MKKPHKAIRCSSAGRRSASCPAQPLLKKSLALARIEVAHADLGTTVEIGKLDTLQKRLGTTVVRFPFYDPEKTRVRS